MSRRGPRVDSGLAAWGQRCLWCAVLMEWWRQKSHESGLRVKGKRGINWYGQSFGGVLMQSDAKKWGASSWGQLSQEKAFFQNWRNSSIFICCWEWFSKEQKSKTSTFPKWQPTFCKHTCKLEDSHKVHLMVASGTEGFAGRMEWLLRMKGHTRKASLRPECREPWSALNQPLQPEGKESDISDISQWNRQSASQPAPHPQTCEVRIKSFVKSQKLALSWETADGYVPS